MRIGANVALAPIKSLAKLPATIFDMALDADQSMRPEGQKLTPEQREGLLLTPKMEQAAASVIKPEVLEFLKPSGAGEELLTQFVGAVPISLLGGAGSVGKAIASTAGGIAGQKIAKGLGYEELGQFLGSLAGSGIAGFAAGPGRPKMVRKELNSMKNADYHAIDNSLKNVRAPAGDILQFVAQEEKELGHKYKSDSSVAEARKYLKELKLKSGERKAEPEINLKTLRESKVRANELARESRSVPMSDLYKRTSKMLTNKLQADAADIPRFTPTFNRAERLTALVHNAEEAARRIVGIADESLKGQLKSTKLGRIFMAGVNPGTELTAFLKKSPEARTYYGQAFLSSMANNPGGVANALMGMDKAYSKYNDEVPDADWQISYPTSSQ